MKNWGSKDKIIAIIEAVTARDLEAEVYSTEKVISENNQPNIYTKKRKVGPKTNHYAT